MKIAATEWVMFGMLVLRKLLFFSNFIKACKKRFYFEQIFGEYQMLYRKYVMEVAMIFRYKYYS